jgi:hypothetical protein
MCHKTCFQVALRLESGFELGLLYIYLGLQVVYWNCKLYFAFRNMMKGLERHVYTSDCNLVSCGILCHCVNFCELIF